MFPLSSNRTLLAVCAAMSLAALSDAPAQLVRVPNTTLTVPPAAPPATLSATGAFSDLATLTPNPGIVAYTPNVSFWSDYARKSRWFSIPNVADRMTFSADGLWSFPTGMVWVKQFDLPNERTNPDGPSRRIETRFLVKTDSGIVGFTYLWRADQREADLVGEDGTDVFYPVLVNGQPTTQRWHYPARYECMECHAPVAGHALGFTSRQMNASHPYGAQNLNQIQALSDAGYFTAPVSGVHNLPALAKASDTSQSLEWRVRSYFAANCVQCHQPGGKSYANWDARPQIKTDAAEIINGMLNYVGSDPANRFVVPGQPNRSMALLRLRGDEPRMPPIATTELDPEAIALVTAWITQELPTRLSFPQWQVQYFGSTRDPNAAATADPDHDGQTNLSEYFTYTDPTRAESAYPTPQGSTANGGTEARFQFLQPANRGALVETSTDLANWTLWDVPENSLTYPAAAIFRTIVAPTDERQRAFRLRFSAP
ncbi:MAG: hypothetical protein M3Z22_08195 [Verrucomicrobiota bacterium]|nr:hypothetical protein [Verrucomicrobiota bacterium]